MTTTIEHNISQQSQDSEVVLKVEGVSKKFCRDLKRSLLYGVQDIAGDLFGLREINDKLRTQEFWALDNVSFELRKGEALGLVGKNGSGKSTLLRIIAGLIKPDMGRVIVKGRVAPLIALGAGFNPILTGRENIYANMSILGLSKQEIDERFDEVVEFAEIGEAIDSPVQTYSSGMAARLGFASAIHTEPDILLIDEVLAVGDIRFKSKCYRHLAKVREKGTTFVLVSHNPHAIFSACELAIYLSLGKTVVSADTWTVMKQYEQDILRSDSLQMQEYQGPIFLPKKSNAESFGMDITYLAFKDRQNNYVDSLVSGKPISFCLGCMAHKAIDEINLHVVVRDVSTENDIVLSLANERDSFQLKALPGELEIQLFFPYLGLKPSLYIMEIRLRQKGLYMLDYAPTFSFRVDSTASVVQCLYYQERSWKVVNISRA